MTLDELRLALAPRIADAAAFDGWSFEAVEAAAADLGVEAAVARHAFAEGPMTMISAFVAWVDAEMARAYPAEALAALPVHKRIRSLLVFRLEAQKGREEALRRALSVMAMPLNAPAALRMGWHSADAMWRLAGDTATDYNHYTKRATLAAVYAATLAVFVGDDSEGKAETLAFLDRRLAGVARFGKAKAKVADAPHFSFVRLAGRLRYPAR